MAGEDAEDAAAPAEGAAAERRRCRRRRRGRRRRSAHGLLREIGDSWIRPLKKPLDLRWRIGYAFAGTLPWIRLNFTAATLEESTFNIFGEVGPGGGPFLDSMTALAQIALAAWFAWLIGYQNRACSPSRFFLEGLLFPGIAASLLLAENGILVKLFGLEGGSP